MCAFCWDEHLVEFSFEWKQAFGVDDPLVELSL